MANDSRITLGQLKTAMNQVRAYVDAQMVAPTQIVHCTSIALERTSVGLTADNTTITLVATVEPSNTTDIITWSVSPTGIVTVDNGLVTAVANGEATVTATCGTQSATCAVTVGGMS